MEQIEITVDGTIWRAVKRPSIFTSRNNAAIQLEDVYIHRQEHDRSMGGTREWSSKHGHHIYFRIASVIACESGEYIRRWSEPPKELIELIDHQNNGT
jgi:hypothetical protein